MQASSAFSVVGDHPDFVVIDKLPGISFHKDDNDTGLVMQVSEQLECDLFPVHRLDKVTSGLLLLAKSSAAASLLSAVFAERRVDKFYLAISDRKPKKKQAIIIGDMVKARRGCWKLTKTRDNPAVSRIVSGALSAGKRLYCIRPATGKTHQIRVALKSIGAPICGDLAYGGTPADRAYLHAWQLHFNYLGEPYAFRADPTVGELFSGGELDALLDSWAQPNALSWPGKMKD